MNKQLQALTAAILLGVLSPLVLGGVSTFPSTPGFDEPVYSQGELDAAVNQGRINGRREAASECIADPNTCGCIDGFDPCGITLNSLLTGALYGETEPNDNIISADPLVPDKLYWGQSLSVLDQDWYYVTTEEPNQIITLDFRVPDASDSNGWNISVRDAAGNILAEFPSTLDPEITYPIFVSYPGTYYVVVQPQSADTLNSRPYNLIASLGFSESDAPPIDVNFFDVETEPNDDYSTADPIVSTVTMYGMLSSTLSGDASIGWGLQTEVDWFWYVSPGYEIASLAWCQREDCTPADGRSWRITVFRGEDSAIMASFSTAVPKTVLVGLEKEGNYFIEVMSELQMDTEGNIVTRCREYSTPEPGGDAPVCLSYAPVATLATDQYNFTWHGTRLPPNTSQP
jgi:hypothetical protein